MAKAALGPLLACCFALASAQHVQEKGILYLDATSFYKVVGHSKPVMVSFDSLIPYGALHDAFVDAAQMTHPSDVVWAVLRVHTGPDGKDESINIAKKFGMADRTLPYVVLFPRWTRDRDNVWFYGETKDPEALIKFLEHHKIKIIRSPESEEETPEEEDDEDRSKTEL